MTLCAREITKFIPMGVYVISRKNSTRNLRYNAIHDYTFAILREIKVVVNCKKLNFPNATYLSTLLISHEMFEI